MSKSIYEEADLILNGRIADGEVKSFKVTGTTYCKITNALKQAQKQEKLLELYKEKDKYTMAVYTLPNVELSEYRSIVKQIKELDICKQHN